MDVGSEVYARCAQVMRETHFVRTVVPVPALSSWSHAWSAGTIAGGEASQSLFYPLWIRRAVPEARSRAASRLELRSCRRERSRRHSAAVMLHLRACYVSKAAILTDPALPVSAENQSPA